MTAMETDLGKPGDCFLAALAGARLAEGEGLTVLVAHGLPIGRGPENMGRRFWHAWVEAKTARGWDVVDLSSGQQVVMRRPAYYRAGQIDGGSQVWRYTLAEALAQVDRTDSAGPWVDGHEEMGL